MIAAAALKDKYGYGYFDAIPYDSIPTGQIQAGSIPLNWENISRQRDEIQSRFEGSVTNKR